MSIPIFCLARAKFAFVYVLSTECVESKRARAVNVQGGVQVRCILDDYRVRYTVIDR